MRGHRTYDRATYYRGVRMVRYDLIKELVVAFVILSIIIVALAAALSSPDVPSVTIRNWADSDPVDFTTAAVTELDGSSTSADYGPPYNNGTGSVQHLWFLHPQEWAGIHEPINSANDFVLQPLQQASVGNPQLSDALSTYTKASTDQQGSWLSNYSDALMKAMADANGNVVVPAGDYGPLPVMMSGLLGVARSGGLDGLLLASDKFYETNYTRPLLFFGDGEYFSGLAEQQNLLAEQWGMMNETGRYPGQAWLWLYTMWYQVGPFNQDGGFLGVNTSNADLAVVFVMGVLSLLLLLVPFIPGLRDIPRWIPIHRLIWRRYYAEERRDRTGSPVPG